MTYALIGCGAIAPSHITAALANDFEIIALCDVAEANLNRIAELIPEPQRSGVKLYADYKEMLAELHPELVALALGSGLKKQVSIDCINAGSNVIVEKPIALSLEEADEMIVAANANNVLLCANHQLRFGNTVRALKAEVEHGCFGKLLHGTVQVRRNRNKAYFDAAKWRGTWKNDGGALMNQCIHYTDLLQWFMGSDVDEVFAYTDRLTHPYIEAEDLGVALIKFKNGAYGVIEGTVNIYPKNLSDTMALFGENGTVSLSGKTLDDVEAWSFASGPADRDSAVRDFEIADMGSGHIPMYADVKRALETGTPPICSPLEGRKALELVLAIYKSAAAGHPVKLPLDRCATTDFVGRFEK